MTDLTNVQIAAALFVGIWSVARTARLIAYDAYPPMMWLRDKWDAKVGASDWGALMHCQFCATPYLAVGMAGWFWLADGHWSWWVINGIWGLSYISAIIVSYDDGT